MREQTTSTSKTVTGIGIIAAIAASLCCITPVLGLLAGVTGAAASLAWLEPARPFLIGLAIVTLGFAWYRSLGGKEAEACGPDGTCIVKKKSFFASRTFLVILTVAAIGLISFPYYSHVFYPQSQKQNIGSKETSSVKEASFTIKGMTCAGCEQHVDSEISKLDGIVETKTSYSTSTSTVRFDTSRTSLDQVKKAIENTGYKITHQQVNQ